MNIKLIKKQLSRLKYLLSLPSVNVGNSKYSSRDEVEELTRLEKGIINQDQNSVEQLLFLLLPTCDLQEISIDSGWGYEFCDIADSLEKELNRLVTHKKFL